MALLDLMMLPSLKESKVFRKWGWEGDFLLLYFFYFESLNVFISKKQTKNPIIF